MAGKWLLVIKRDIFFLQDSLVHPEIHKILSCFISKCCQFITSYYLFNAIMKLFQSFYVHAPSTCVWINTACQSLNYHLWNYPWWWNSKASTGYQATPKLDINYRIIWYVILALEEFNCYYSQRIERLRSCLLCLVSHSCTTTSLLIICGIILQEVWTKEVGKRVFGAGGKKKKNPTCSGLIHIAGFTVTAFPIERKLACTQPGSGSDTLKSAQGCS